MGVKILSKASVAASTNVLEKTVQEVNVALNVIEKTWTAPAWLPPLSGSNCVSGTYKIYSVGPSYVAFTATTGGENYRVNWGDGNIETFASGTIAEHQYDYTNGSLSVGEAGKFKYAIITIEPIGVGGTFDLISVDLSVIHSALPQTKTFSSGFVDIKVNVPSLTLIKFNSHVYPFYLRMLNLERVSITSSSISSFYRTFDQCIALRSVPVINSSVAITSTENMFMYCYNLIEVGSFDTSNVTTMSGMFCGCYSISNIPFLSMASCLNLDSMFYDCKNLLTVQDIDAPQATTANSIFGQCYSITSIAFTNVPNLTNLYGGFRDCRALKKLYFKNIQNITTFSAMAFTWCHSLEYLNFGDMPLLTTMPDLQNCFSLKEVVITNADSLTSLNSAFSNCYSLQKVTLPENLPALTSMNGTFYGCTSLEEISILSNIPNVTSMSGLFQNCRNLKKVTIAKKPNVPINCSSMFQGCYTLKKVIIPETFAASSTYKMFEDCRTLIEPPLFDTSFATNVSYMFGTCNSLTYIPPYNIDNAENAAAMFSSCWNLTKIDMIHTGTSLTNTSYMFSSCYALGKASKINTENVTDMYGMFSSSYSLNDISETLYNGMSNATNTEYMLYGCKSIQQVPTLNISNVTNARYMFQNCESLEKITFIDNALQLRNDSTFSYMFWDCINLKSVSGISFVNTDSNYNSYLFNGCINLSECITTNIQEDVTFSNCFMQKPEIDSLISQVVPTMNGFKNRFINFSNNPGVIKKSVSGVDTIRGSTTITFTTTNVGLTVGMYVHGIGVGAYSSTSASASTATSTLTYAGHGLSNNDVISFDYFGTITGPTFRTPYYVINTTTDTFQISSTIGGPAITFGGEDYPYCGMVYPVFITDIQPSYISISKPVGINQTNVPLSFTNIDISYAALRGWNVGL